ncbi:hypothetical protein ACRALDRAFT_1046582 [Sodiomyces alcalophilus JCM 7366]|uniref:uncharacterized protein n=1 Tax=Sodiomyces alcalophilus JCM 7366 TaxID=591952 RepID=UPI0039B384E8
MASYFRPTEITAHPVDSQGARRRLYGSRTKYWANKLAVDEAEPGLTSSQLMLTNKDLKPVEKARRVWGPWNFVGFWVADCFNINTWMIGGAMVAGGLSWWQAWLCVWIGYFVAAVFVVLAGRVGAVYHISFPVVARSSFGVWGGLWPVFNRTVMACVWYGVQAYIGGHCVYVMIRAIWTNWGDILNTFPRDSGTTTPDFVSFFIFWLLSLPAIWFPVHKIRHLFTVKAYVVPTAGLAFLIWTVVRAGGVGPIIRQPARVSGSEWSWQFVQGIMSSIANFATLIVNDSDFSRFAIKPRDALWSQLFTIPVGFAVTSFIGIIVSSASAILYEGDPIWDPIDVLDKFIDGGNSGERFGVFVLGLSFALAQLGTNIAANSVSAGTDMTAILPRFINIRRGGYICAAVGFAINPWILLTDSSQFTTYLSAYSVFLSSIAGVMIADYYFVRKGYIVVEDLYRAKKGTSYYFTFGLHWRAYAAYVAGILINVVGFADAVGTPVPMGAVYIYRVNFFAGFIVSSTMYWLLCHFFPIPATSDRWAEVGGEDLDEVIVAYSPDSYSGQERFDEEAKVSSKPAGEDVISNQHGKATLI